MTTFEHLLVEKQDKIAWVSIHRLKKLNALNAVLLEELHQLFLFLKEQKDVRVIVLTGSGEKAFVAGADIAEFAQFDAQQGKTLSRRGQETVFDLIAQSSKPVIAAINGFALGGGLELALSCHIRIASTNARMGLPETSLGVIPGYGGTQRLAQLIGRGRATEMILSCRMISAEEALDVGLVSQVVSQEELLSSAAALAEKIMRNSSNAMGHALKAIEAAYQEGVAGFEQEINAFGECFGHPEFKEGTQAFLEKRKANF
ncbi:MAG: enoyl-CoA hydratase-related protein [Flavobacteriaceae bacterium]